MLASALTAHPRVNLKKQYSNLPQHPKVNSIFKKRFKRSHEQLQITVNLETKKNTRLIHLYVHLHGDLRFNMKLNQHPELEWIEARGFLIF